MMRHTIWGGGLLALMFGFVALAGCDHEIPAPDEPQPKTHTVRIEGMAFRPQVLTVAAGDSIVWVNKDLVPHSATSGEGRFDSKVIAADKSWTYTTRTQGDFDYICTFHPTMTALIHVK